MPPNASGAVGIRRPSDGGRYEAVLRLSEALSSCREPEELTKILSEQMGEFLDFLQFYIIVYKQNSTEAEWAVLGREKSLISVYADVPVQLRPSWQAYSTQEPFHISDWNADERVPAGLKQGLAAQGIEIGPLVFVPLTTPHRRLGALGMSGAPRTVYGPDDISFLRLIGRVVAFAIDDNFNLRQAEAAKAELQRQNDRLRRSERELREVIERIPGMAWTGVPDGSSTFVNSRWSEYTGLSLEDTSGSGWQIAVHPDDLERAVEASRKSVASGEPFEFEVRFRRAADGEYRWFLVRGVPLRDEHGQVLKWYGITTDIEDRKRAEQALTVQNNRMQLLVNLATKITSSLDLREVLRAVAANTREVIHADAVVFSLPDTASGKFRIFAVDFPHGKGVIKEELLVTPSAAVKEAIDTLKPVVSDGNELSSVAHEVAAAEGLKRICSIPLVNRGRALGILSILRTTETAFSPDDVDFFTRTSGPMAIAVENALAFQEVSSLGARLQLLLNLATRITSNLDLREVLRAIAANIREVMHADAATVSLHDAAPDKFRVLAVDFPHGKGVIKEELLVTPSAAARKAMDTFKPVVIHTWEPEGVSEMHDLAAAEGLKAFCNVPLLNRGRFLGMLSILRTTETPFTPEDVDFLSRASGQIAIAVENALAFQEISGLVEERKRAAQALAIQNTRLQVLLELSKRITSNLELREVLRSVSVAAREIMRADAAGVAFFDEASDKARIYAVDFPNAKGFVKEEIVVTPGLAFRRAWEGSQPEVLNTNDREELGPEIYGLVIAEGLNGHCLIPLVSRGRTVGVLIVASKLRDAITPEDVDFLSRASGQIAIAIENALAFREISELKDKLVQEKLYLEEEIRGDIDFDFIVGNSPALKSVLHLVETVALSDSTVLLLGETGTGKELIARAIHDRSRRKQRTLVKLNCAAIPTGLLESELFGHEKGAFTGAVTQKIGRLELADQGTLFLDEVGDIPIEIQPKLLRALQEREFERLGSTHTRKVNVRLVAATNRDLEKMIAAREFRSDLYYRLNVFPIRIPPLRDRREDIPLLVSYFVERFAKQMQKKIETIPAAVMKALKAWHWPGNIRELENLTERAVILTRGTSLEAPLAELQKTKTEESPNADLPKTEQVGGERTNSRSDKSSVADEYARKQRDAMVRALAESKGRVGGPDGAAARLGINRTTLLARMKKFGIDRRQYA